MTLSNVIQGQVVMLVREMVHPFHFHLPPDHCRHWFLYLSILLSEFPYLFIQSRYLTWQLLVLIRGSIRIRQTLPDWLLSESNVHRETMHTYQCISSSRAHRISAPKVHSAVHCPFFLFISISSCFSFHDAVMQHDSCISGGGADSTAANNTCCIRKTQNRQ